jgi:N-methylhydantoinase A
MISIGIDVGGTHTDLVALNEKGEIVAVDKVKTTNEDIPKAIIGLIVENFKDKIKNINLIVNGTTVGTNAILERKIPEIALITTKGFRDVLLMRRETKAEMTNLQWDKASPLVKRRNIFEIDERIDYNGGIFKPLNENSVMQVIDKIKERKINTIAVILIHSYANPMHEKRVRDIILKEMPVSSITISYDILPEWREFERTYNTVLAAVLKPVLASYIVDLQNRLEKIGFQGDLEIMQANAGVASVENITLNPSSTLFSGVAGGVVGGMMNSSAEEDEGNIINFDMGGTSTDISLVNNGAYTISTELELEWEGYLRFPCIDIHSIGAGGGSIAWVDDAKCLHVGPQSAGAFPGPACYDTGGVEPTVTDVNLVLGYLNPKNYIGGRYLLSAQRAEKAIEDIAHRSELNVLECALGIRAIVDSNMVYGIRHVSIERGNDPREYSLVAFGGAGPLHAAEVMKQLGMKRAIIPLFPGNVSAVGLLGARPKIDLMRTKYGKLEDVNIKELESIFHALEIEGMKRLKFAGIESKNIEIRRSFDMRYTGQTHEIIIESIPLDLSDIKKEFIAELFHKKHNELYSYYNQYEPIAIVSLRVSVLGSERKITLSIAKRSQAKPAPTEKRTLMFKTNGGVEKVETDIFNRNDLSPGFKYDGPVVVEEALSTTLIPPGFRVKVLERGVLEIQEQK